MSTLYDVDSAGLEMLDRRTCYALLKTVPIGRIVFTEAALPAIQPVNFILDGDAVVIRTGLASKLVKAAQSAIVAFECDDCDDCDEQGMTAWSVVLIGRAEAVGDEAERRRLAGQGLTPWALGPRPHFIRVTPEIVRGWRIRPRPAAF